MFILIKKLNCELTVGIICYKTKLLIEFIHVLGTLKTYSPAQPAMFEDVWRN